MKITTNSNHATPLFNRQITTLPQTLAKSEERKSSLYKLIAKVCLVALLTLFAIAMAISFGLLPIAHPAITFLSITLIGFISMIGLQHGTLRSVDWHFKAVQDQGKAEELKKIQNWGKAEIEAFLEEHKISSASLPILQLQRLNAKEPLKALLPAIASYFYWSNTAGKHLEDHIKNFYTDAKDSYLREHGGIIGWQILESQALPAAIQAAYILQIIAEPTMRKELNQMGSLQAKSLEQRSVEWMRDGTDHYFIFEDPSLSPLSLQELQQLLHTKDFDKIRAKLFTPVKGTQSDPALLQ